MSLQAWFWLSSHYPLFEEPPAPVAVIPRPVSPIKSGKLSDADVAEIKQLRAQGVILREIAERFGVSVPAIHHVVKGRKRK